MKSALEAISVAAVVLSLVFVGLQMNESTRATRSATAAETTATIADWYTFVASDQQVSSVLRRFIIDPPIAHRRRAISSCDDISLANAHFAEQFLS